MKKYLLTLLFLVASLPIVAAEKASDLARDTLNYVQSGENMLAGAIRNGSQSKFDQFVMVPTMDMMKRWPRLGESAEHDRLIFCYFALDAFRIYAEDQFKARGALPKTSSSDRLYREQKAKCSALVKR